MDARAGYNLCTSAAQTELLSAWGLDLLSVLNNHSFDCGPTGPNETASLLTSAGLYPIGLSPEPLTLRINGLELAFLAFDDILSPIETSTSIRAIQFARANGALVVVSIHWGMEYHQGPSDRQKTLAQQFADAGAVLVVGTHPHVLQPAEWIRTAWGQTLVLFSLGNAMFDQGGLADTRQSALITVKLDSHGVKSARTAPFEIDVSRSLIIQPDVQTAQQIRDRINLP
jgi:poly-gamma-glutamate capsule biosynthesis protein CapA/YwtB (metallophosphatase superfamily)